MNQHELTLVVVKPDAVRRHIIGKILSRYERQGLRIKATKEILMTKNQAEILYEEHKSHPLFNDLINYLISGQSLIVILEGMRTIKTVRKLHGDANPVKAAPGTIRADYGITFIENSVHCSDSQENAKREINIFFNE